MAQVQVTLDYLRSYVRSLDERLVNTKKYTDVWVDDKINTGYELWVTKTQTFFKEEVLDLKEYINDGTAKFEVEMDEDISGWRKNFYTGDFPTAIKWEVNPDNKVMVELDLQVMQDNGNNLLTFQFYFYPNTKTGDQYMSTDIHKGVENAIASATFNDLRDYEKRDSYDVQVDYNAKTITNGLDYYAGDVIKNNWDIPASTSSNFFA